ncbi:transformer-2 protein homolog beta-like isoform X1 [Branchiostoma floridae]|uniref:Transformer-2 protein homolog beta-like isoform X1 n=2 Tax=Branchiostoma floridae TaxID=7739 RepID=A0A9J7L1E6_BRAFL|nr:transformer-2 protein homolog beta-like isoform X1 [Branchiostoma floridae]
MQKPTESLEEEREILKYLKKLNEANKEIEERDKMLAELKADKEKEEIEIKNLRQEFNRVNKKRIDSEEGAKKKIGEQEKMISKLLWENQQLKQTENEYKNLQGIFETLKESRKELKSKVEHLEAVIQTMQEREKEWEVEIDASKAEVQREKETTEKAEQGAKQQQDKLNAEVQIEKEKRKEALKNAEQLRVELEALKAQKNREVQADQGGEPNQSSPPQGYEPDKLFVVGLSWGTSEASLCQAFSRFGTVTECKVIRDHWTGRSRGFGFVKFSAPSEADVARKDMHFQHLDGRTIRVDYAKYRFGSAASNERYTCRNYSGLGRSHYNSGKSSYYNSGYVRDSYYGHRGGNYHDNYRSYYSDEYESNHGGGDY